MNINSSEIIHFVDISGVIKVNNRITKSNEIQQLCGYLHQNDIFTEYLTVNEHLQFNVSF